MWLFALLLWLVFVIWFAIEPRAIWPGFLFVFGALAAVAALLAAAVDLPVPDNFAPVLETGFAALAIVVTFTPVLVGLLLLANFFVMWRKEGLRARLTQLCGILGFGILAYFATLMVAFWTGSTNVLSLMAGLTVPMAALAIGFICFVSYSGFYQWWFSRFGKRVDAVVVLGSAVRGDKVPPLLAKRIDRGITLASEKASAPQIPMVMSGGKGDDERVPEAQAMADYAVEQGVDPHRIWQENRSTTTEENMRFTKEMLEHQAIFGPVAVATNDYHAFRAATYMRRVKLPGYAVGYRTARYYWPSAMIREYVALLRDHIWFVAIMLGLACLPLLAISIGVFG